MTDEVRLYVFGCGWLEIPRHVARMNESGQGFRVPVPFFLITHPRGHVLFDGGNANAVASDPRGHWGEEWEQARMTEDDFCLNQLERLGVDPAEIRYVVQSHLHLDHTGALGHFPWAQYIVQRRELDYAYHPDWFMRTIYIRADFDRPDLRWILLDGEDDDSYDVHGDGVIRTLFTPGHSIGHTSLVVTLPETGAVVLTGDAAYTRAHLDDRVLPGILHSAGDIVRSTGRLRRTIDALEATAIAGHDPEQWPSLRLAPEYYG